MQRMMCIPLEEYNQMVKEIKELRRKVYLGAMGKLYNEDPEMVRLDKLFEIMRESDCNLDTAELILQDQEADADGEA